MTRRRTKGPDCFTGDLFQNLALPDAEPEPEPTPTRSAARETAAQMLGVLDNWVERGWLRTLDAAFARFLWTEAPHCPPLLLLAAALASHQLGRGHVCLDLKATLEDPAFALSLPPDGPQVLAATPAQPPAEVLAGVTLAQWRAALAVPDLVSEESASAEPANEAAGNTPLVLAGTRLYLRRYWQYEQDVRAGIERRLARAAQVEAGLPLEVARSALDALFAPRSKEGPRTADWQKLACALAARSAFSIVTGGPGTGKTTTVVRLLALLQTLALGRAGQGARAARPLRIRLAAPTGKAAARLNESIAGAVERLPFEALQAHVDPATLRNAIPTVVATLHRVLGTRPGSRRFRHDAANPLPVDVLVIDEASMVDLEMMAAVLDALPSSARLILLGDKDQLASVEAGAVLGELCDRAREGHYTQASRTWLEATTGERIDAAMLDEHGLPLDQAIAMLRESHRFASESGIGALAELVNAGDAVAVAKIWSRGYGDLARIVCQADDDGPLRALVVEGRVDESGSVQAQRHGYRHYLETMRATRPEPGAPPEALADWAAGVLRAHGAFQLLCALRRGPWGVEGLNRRVARLLHEEGLIDPHGDWYAGRPVLVTHNDYELGLMNGDIGIALELPVAAGEPTVLRVAFPAGDGSGTVKWVSPSRLQGVETVFALTVHKSQGSEFTHAALVLPDTYSPILTRELVYTGITRARSFLTLAVPEGRAVLDRAVLAKVQRASGLMAGLARDAQAA